MANFFKATTKAKTKATISKEPLTISIDKLDTNGVGVARWNNKPLFIAGALPTEVVTAKVVEQKNKYARAKLITVNVKNERRVEPHCNHFGLCGGCDLQMLELEGQLQFKQQKVAELFSRSFSQVRQHNKTQSLDLPWHESIKSNPWNYRRKARIGVQFDKQSQATIGFRQKATNQLAAIKSCSVLVEPIHAIFPLLKAVLAKLTIKSAIGHIEVLQADITDKNLSNSHIDKDKVVVVVRQLKPMNDEDVGLWKSYAERHHWYVFIDDGKKQTPLNGDNHKSNPVLSYALSNDNHIYFESSDFIQINHQVNIAMIDQAIAWLTLQPSDIVLDLFCGLGNFSLSLAHHVKEVIGVEGVQVMVDKASYNAQVNTLTNCQFYQADLNSHWLSENWATSNIYNKVLLDPARAGAEEAVSQIATLKIPTVLYVSCDPATLARDAAILVSQGYKIEKISLMDMFSQTKHVETMVLFTL